MLPFFGVGKSHCGKITFDAKLLLAIIRLYQQSPATNRVYLQLKYVTKVRDWLYSSIHLYVKNGINLIAGVTV